VSSADVSVGSVPHHVDEPTQRDAGMAADCSLPVGCGPTVTV